MGKDKGCTGWSWNPERCVSITEPNSGEARRSEQTTVGCLDSQGSESEASVYRLPARPPRWEDLAQRARSCLPCGQRATRRS